MSSTASPAAVTVELVYLARLREAFGRAAERLAIAPRAAGAPQVEDVLAALVARGGAFANRFRAALRLKHPSGKADNQLGFIPCPAT